ncbi:hypothetical protein ABEB36_007062 [Hypothenemus hampei]|uniref:Major facilitator superfamily (MFS) profile domain-containing protein n=1 Tax=Hypothenemus hampei TaxID=57062 RepID=A0ABD1ETJ0_HYPHA
MAATKFCEKNFIYFAVFTVNLITFAAGGCWSWTSPVLPKLRSTDPNVNPLSEPTTTFEESWIAGIMNLGAIAGPFAAGVMSEKFGKKIALLVLASPIVFSHVLSIFATNIHFFLAARLLIGIGAGAVFSIVPGYLGEIAEDTNRGLLGSMMGVFNCLGILLMYLIGPFVSLRVFGFINLLAPITFFVLFGVLTPASPYDLIKQGKTYEAELSLAKLRGKCSSDVQKELAQIIDSIQCFSDSTVGLKLLKNKAFVKAMIICLALMALQQLSGIGAVLGYMQNIFESTGSSIPSEYLSILIGSIQLISNVCSAQLVEKAGRKILLIISNIFSAIALISLGAYFYMLSSSMDVSCMNWLPIVSLITFIITFNLGLANLPWVILSELFPANIKPLSSTVATFFCFGLSFVVNICFPIITETLGMPGTFWIFAGILFVGFTFSIIIIPETKGKSSLEIQHMLSETKK